MSTSTTSSTMNKVEKDLTFRNYEAKQAAAYARHRPGYPDKLIETAMSIHTSTGGKLDILLDVGCGPGTATRSFAKYFKHAFGVDPGEKMIEAAKSIPATTSIGENVQYITGTAEGIDSLDFGSNSTDIQTEGGGGGVVDLITATVAAHWFDLPSFYASAAKILKPTGTIIFIGTGSLYCDPYTTPNSTRAQEVLLDLELNVLGPYETEGNRQCRELYRNLPLPWSINSKDGNPSELEQQNASIFDQENFVKMEFNADGKLEPGELFLRGGRGTFQEMEWAVGTASMATRWREAHKKELENGQIEDCVSSMVKKLKKVINEGRPDDQPEINEIDVGTSIVLFGIKKKAFD